MGSGLMKKNINKIIPTEIISEILTRIPTESVLECKLVCKTWKNLIQHPSFPKMHLARLNHPDSIESGKLRYICFKKDYDNGNRYRAKKHLSYFEFNDNEDWNYAKPIYKKINIKTNFEDYIIIGSFNGLICLYETQSYMSYMHYARGPAIIINPVTKEYVFLPNFITFSESTLLRPFRHIHEACGFGYLASTNEYKVVRIYNVRASFVEVDVYTVGSGKGWRHVGKFDFGFTFHIHPRQIHGVFLNECLHWRNRVGGMVLVFDLAQEKFRDHISPPTMRRETDDDRDEHVVFGVSGEILYYAVYETFEWGYFDDVWLLMKKSNDLVAKEHEEHQSWGWSKVTSLEQSEPFAFTKEFEIVLRYDEGTIKVFYPSSSTWENFENFKEISLQVFRHKHTLVSLKELGEANAKVMKSKGIED